MAICKERLRQPARPPKISPRRKHWSLYSHTLERCQAVSAVSDAMRMLDETWTVAITHDFDDNGVMRVPQAGYWLLGMLWLCSCDSNVSSLDQIYSRPGDGPVTCGFNLDDKNAVSTDAINSALDRAQLEASVVHLYSHHAPNTVDVSTIALVVQAAETRGMRSTTYRELTVDGPAPLEGALALSFDDRSIDSWLELLPLFSAHHTRVTFFISAFSTFDDTDLQGLRRLADAGHDIQYHSTRHENAVTYSDLHGIDQYVRDDIEPGLAAMRGAGFDPVVFAYPFGARNAELDQTLLAYFPLLRGSHFSCPR